MVKATYQHKTKGVQVNVLDVQPIGICSVVSFIDKQGNTHKKGLQSFKQEYFYVRGQRL